jgi:hypothetical protein
MQQKIKSKILELGKSTYLIDLLRHPSGIQYVSINQIIRTEKEASNKNQIKIHIDLLDELINVLEEFKSNHFDNKVVQKTKDDKNELVRRYLKGVDINALILQFNYTQEEIHQILYNQGIVVVKNQKPYKKRWKKNKV